jgi:hypothetical protein
MSIDVNIEKRATEYRFDHLETSAYVGAFCTRSDAARVVRGHLQHAFVVTA